MARRRLQAILATTVITVGLSSGPVLAQELPGVTELEEAVTSATEDVVETTEDVVDTVTEPVTGSTAEEPAAEDTSSEDEALLDVGTGDGTLDVDLDVDVAPSDEDGSPQLEIDGGVTVADQEVDLGGATDPIEDAVDPDPAPTDGDTDSTQDDDTTAPRSGPGGLLAGGGVVAAGDGARPASTSTAAPRGTGGGSGFSGFGGFARDDFGPDRFGGGTMHLDRVPDPEVAPPLADSAERGDSLGTSPELPAVAGDSTPAVLATETPMGDDSPLTAALRALAGALVLATGAAWTRATRDA